LQFSQEEISNLKEIFDLFDKEKNGSINIKDLEAIMQSLQRDPQEALDILSAIRQDKGSEPAPSGELENVLFEEFIELMQQVENKLARDDPENLNRQAF
jgi:Ca2+-binding EF-hand superfamily protein